VTKMDTKTRAIAILDGIKKAGINIIASLPDINLLDLIGELERDGEMIHVPLCREEEGVGICAGARLVGKKPAIIMQNAGLLNSCNAIVTTAIQLELPILLIVYYAGDIGDRGFARVGTATVPVLEALGVRHYVLRSAEEIDWTFKNAWILAEDSGRPVAVLLTKDVLGTRS
jgi:sulfopyruvate decarboxylase subunit alpha